MSKDNYRIDFTFVDNRENLSQLQVYLAPMCSEKNRRFKDNKICFGKDFVSIFNKRAGKGNDGFKLSRNNIYDFQQLRLPPDLQMKLMSFILKQDVGIGKAFHQEMLVLSSYEAEVMDKREKQLHARILQKKYNRDSNVLFERLPYEAQTVLFSITYYWGLESIHTTLKLFWSAAIVQDYSEMCTILLSFGADQMKRRKEAEFLQKMIIRLKSGPNWIIDESFVSFD